MYTDCAEVGRGCLGRRYLSWFVGSDPLPGNTSAQDGRAVPSRGAPQQHGLGDGCADTHRSLDGRDTTTSNNVRKQERSKTLPYEITALVSRRLQPLRGLFPPLVLHSETASGAGPGCIVPPVINEPIPVLVQPLCKVALPSGARGREGGLGTSSWLGCRWSRPGWWTVCRWEKAVALERLEMVRSKEPAVQA